MDAHVLALWSMVLTAGVIGNLLITARIAASLRQRPFVDPGPGSLPVGDALPTFDARRWTDNTSIAFPDSRLQPAVLVFLSEHCPACRSTIPDLARVADIGPNLGVSLWIVPEDDPGHLVASLGHGRLRDCVLDVSANDRARLNPQRSMPLYIFVNAAGQVEASDRVGDPDWQSFMTQVTEAAA